MQITVMGILTATAFTFFGYAFIVLGLLGLGKGKADGAGTAFLTVGIVNGILSFVILGLSLFGFITGKLTEGDAAFNIFIALLVLIFAYTWANAGVVNIKVFDLKPLGNAAILMGMTMIAFGVIFARLGAIWLAVNVFSWAWAFWSVTLASYEKISLKVVGWTFLIQAFYTLWIPGTILFFQGALP